MISASPDRVRKAKWALRATFFFMGVAVSATSARMAEVQHHVGASDALFGYSIMVGNIGAIIGNLFGNKILRRMGTRFLAQLVMFGIVASQISYGFARELWQIPLIAFVAGASYSLMNVACNSQGTMIQQNMGRSLMPSFHGSWSVGAFSASLLAGLLAKHVALEWHLLANVLVALCGCLVVSRALLPSSADQENKASNAGVKSHQPLPRHIKQFIFWVAFGSLLATITETSVADWSSIFLNNNLKIPIGLNTLGYTSFVLPQILGRFTMGKLIDKHGIPRVIKYGGIIGGCGYVGGLLIADAIHVHHKIAALVAMCIAYGILGYGISPMPPSYASVAGSIPGIPTSRGIARMAVIASSGFLLGRFIISTLAGLIGLQYALLFPASTLIVSGVISYRLNHDRIRAPALIDH